MARTRTQIKTLVIAHTGRDKDTVMNSLCDSALKLAIQVHPFWDSITNTYSDFAITTSATSVDITTASAIHVLTARIVETDGKRNAPLKLKNRVWWDKHVVNAEDNMQGWPAYAMHIRGGNTVYLDRPADSGLTLRIRESTAKTFASDDTACPIECLDIFVEQYVTAEIFASIGDMDKYWIWRRRAVGPKFDDGSEVGGSLLRAINDDKYGLGEDVAMEEPSAYDRAQTGLAILNQITDHERYGEIDWWH